MAKKRWSRNSVILITILVILGVIALVSVLWVFSTQEVLITGEVLNTIGCSQTCASPIGYSQWKATNQQSCILNCCTSQCASPVAYSQFGAVNQQDCVKKCSALPALTSTGMIRVGRLKALASVL